MLRPTRRARSARTAVAVGARAAVVAAAVAALGLAAATRAFGQCGGPGGCFTPHPTAGCANVSCCQAVCAVDPFCCTAPWDSSCVNLAEQLCPSSGVCPGSGNCWLPHGTPGCNDAECCTTVCTADTFCCDVAWDELCADEAAKLCVIPCEPVCGKVNVACLTGTPAWGNSRPVGQFLASGIPVCTAWIVAAPDIVMTTWHCANIGAPSFSVRFGFECDECEDGVERGGQTLPVIEVIHENLALDYALLRVGGRPADMWGVVTIAQGWPELGEGVYEIHHGEGGVKGYSDGQVVSLDVPGVCGPGTAGEFGITAVATIGAAGAPIFSAETHCVVGMDHCGPACAAGWGVPLAMILPDALPHLASAGAAWQSCANLCPADLDATGNVGFGDLTALLINWGSCGGSTCLGDLTGDNIVGFADLTFLLVNWGECS